MWLHTIFESARRKNYCGFISAVFIYHWKLQDLSVLGQKRNVWCESCVIFHFAKCTRAEPAAVCLQQAINLVLNLTSQFYFLFNVTLVVETLCLSSQETSLSRSSPLSCSFLCAVLLDHKWTEALWNVKSAVFNPVRSWVMCGVTWTGQNHQTYLTVERCGRFGPDGQPAFWSTGWPWGQLCEVISYIDWLSTD